MRISRAGQTLGKLPAESRLTKARENASHDADYDLRRSGDVCSEGKEVKRIATRRLREPPRVLSRPLRVAQF